MAKIIAKNKAARYNYEIIKIYEAGLALEGWEVKSIRAARVQLKSAFISFVKNEAFLSNMHINLYMNVKGDETRARKLLLHKQQLKHLKANIQAKGMTIIPVALKWSKRGYVKLDIALARGKSKIDKRETIKKRDQERALKRFL